MVRNCKSQLIILRLTASFVGMLWSAQLALSRFGSGREMTGLLLSMLPAVHGSSTPTYGYWFFHLLNQMLTCDLTARELLPLISLTLTVTLRLTLTPTI